MSTNPHDLYAADYDNQIRAYDCHLAEVLFGLCYEYAQPRQILLDVGIGSGLSATLFAKAGLNIFGMDFSPAMLEICQGKGIAVDLKQHDLKQIPWQYPAAQFNHVVCCGVFHFASDLDSIFSEVARVLRVSGYLPSPPKRRHPHPTSQNMRSNLQVTLKSSRTCRNTCNPYWRDNPSSR